MDRVRQMEIFVQVMESGSFTRAADALRMPRSTVSTVIQSLEDRLGAQLLQRSTRRMVPTDEGRRFLDTARKIVDDVSATDQMFRQPGNQVRGRLRIDMPSRIGRRCVIPALPGLLKSHPELQIEISTTDRMVNLIAERMDCLIRVGTTLNSEITCEKLGDVQIITCASPEYLKARGIPVGLDDLTRHEMVNYGSSLPTAPPSFDYFSQGRAIEMQMTSRVAVNNAEAYIAAARAGLGMIQVPAFDVQDLLISGALVPVLQYLCPPSMPLSLLYAKGRNVPARIAVFRDWVNDLLRRKGVFDPLDGKVI